MRVRRQIAFFMFSIILILINTEAQANIFSKSDTYVGGSKKNLIADLNNDGFNDIIAGSTILLNDGSGNFMVKSVLDTYVNLPHRYGNDVKDLDNDGDLDYVFCANDPNFPRCEIFINDGDANFILATTYSLSPGYVYDCRAADLNNDGYVDIAANGHAYWYLNKILWNQKDGTFVMKEVPPQQCTRGLDVGDYDKDGDFDFLWSCNGGPYPTYIAPNNGDGTFFGMVATFGKAYISGSPISTFVDLNRDGFLDTLIVNDISTNVFLNNRNNSFSLFSGPFPVKLYKSADIDNDGDEDVSPNYLNDGTGNLSITNETWAIWHALGDLNNDGFLDMAHEDGYIYYNNLANELENSPPSIPSTLTFFATESSVAFSWDKSNDDFTPQENIKYNLRVGTIPGENNLMSGVTPGWSPNTEYNNSWTLKLDMKQICTIYWSVQSQDGSFVRSNWADEQTAIFDPDNDGIGYACDVCPENYNPDQIDTDLDGLGDPCDDDDDNDLILDGDDNCPLNWNPDQSDSDQDGAGNLCDIDNDNDGITDDVDKCLSTTGFDIVNDDGCSITDFCPCENSWRNHGTYVRCVAHSSEDFFMESLISEETKDAIISEAAQSSCGEKIK